MQRPPRQAAKCSRSAFAVQARNARAAPGKLSVSRAGEEGFHFRGAPRLARPAGRTAGGAARESKTLRRKGTGPLVRTCHAERPRPRRVGTPPAQVKTEAMQFDAIWESESFGVRRDLAQPDDDKSVPANCDELCAERDDQAVHRGSRNSELSTYDGNRARKRSEAPLPSQVFGFLEKIIDTPHPTYTG